MFREQLTVNVLSNVLFMVIVAVVCIVVTGDPKAVTIGSLISWLERFPHKQQIEQLEKELRVLREEFIAEVQGRGKSGK